MMNDTFLSQVGLAFFEKEGFAVFEQTTRKYPGMKAFMLTKDIVVPR